MKTGQLIKELRIKKGMTQEELAAKTEVSARTIQRIEHGEVDPRAYTLQMIARALDVDFSLFAEYETEEEQEINQMNENHRLGLLHLSGLLPFIFPTLITWRLIRDSLHHASHHFRAVITLQLATWAIILVGLWIYWWADQPIPLVGGLLAGGLLSIVNALRVTGGFPFINPWIKDGDIGDE